MLLICIFQVVTLVLDHGHNVYPHHFCILEKILVKVGDRVEQGDKIALVGATGRVTGPHLGLAHELASTAY